eukprot:5522543-Pyramimonas_sp.AAC.1
MRKKRAAWPRHSPTSPTVLSTLRRENCATPQRCYQTTAASKVMRPEPTRRPYSTVTVESIPLTRGLLCPDGDSLPLGPNTRIPFVDCASLSMATS